MSETAMTTSSGGTVVRPGGGPGATSPAVGLKRFLDARIDNLAQWVKGRIEPASLIRFALLDYSQSEQLQRCTPESIYLALIACAQVGLTPGALKQEAFIVPYGQTATFMVGWRGLVKLALRSGLVKSLKSQVVYENDRFEIDLGTNERVIHSPALKQRGEIIGAYAIAKLEDGEIEVEWMSLEDLEKVRRSSKRGDRESPAYRDWADQMYRKAPIRRLCKRLPLGEDYVLAVKMDETAESGDVAAHRRVINVEGDVPEAAIPAPALVQDTAPPAKGVAGAKEALRRAKAKQAEAKAPEPEQPPAGERPALADVRAIHDALERIQENPGELLDLRERIERLPAGPDQEALRKMWKAADQLLDEAAEAAVANPPRTT